MNDPRLTPANARVVLRGHADPAESRQVVEGRPAQVTHPVVDLDRRPGGPRDRQVLFGEPVLVLEERQGKAFVQAGKDGYVGYLPSDTLGQPRNTTHQVTARTTHVYSEPDLKSPERFALSFGSQLAVTQKAGSFCQTPDGFLPKQHLRPIDQALDDPVAVARQFLGTPYLWGGNSGWGIDCSGLVQAACLATGLPCPGDSDLQQKALGDLLDPGTPPQRGDLLFWKGHVAWVGDEHSLLHANAFHMAVVEEPLALALQRIEAEYGNPVTAHRRLT